jgi:hypothetical protein
LCIRRLNCAPALAVLLEGADCCRSESLQAWVELFCFQMAKMNKADADRELGGLTAMAKATVLLFGGNGCVPTLA